MQDSHFFGAEKRVSTTGDQYEKSNIIIVVLSFFAFSFPVLSLMEDGESASSSLSFFTIPSIISIVILSIYAFFSVNHKVKFVFVISFFVGTLISFYSMYNMQFYDLDKFENFYFVLVLFGYFLFINLFIREVRRNLDVILLSSGILGLLLLLLSPTEYDAGRITYGDSNPIWMGRVLGVGALAAAAVAINRPRLRFPAIGSFVLIALSVLVTGSRGPFLSVLLSIAVTFGLKKFSNKYTIVSVFIYIIFTAMIIIYGFFPDYFRALSFGGINDESFGHRSHMMNYSIDIIRSAPGGIGVGQFFFNGFTYPHNVIMESFVEWGWFYGFFYSVFLIVGVASCVLLEKRFFLFPLLAVFDFLNAIVSGDMTSPRLLYGFSLYGWYMLFAFLGEERRKRRKFRQGVVV